ncbi:DUF2971 domain-containing protein (plasmid) [Bacillus toyonensis]|nr:DUF2971 domain-containing protein [Bacillus toyonensis]QWI35390.1 DUF2971 domain-containing protein [Bacillus toyonensis]
MVKNEWVDSNIKGDAKLWRYMDFTKLVSMLSTQSMFFCRADNFRDKYEGKIFAYTDEIAATSLDRVLKASNLSQQVKNNVLEDVGSIKNMLFAQMDIERTRAFINCWHLNAYESAAMWDLYSNGREGIAIQTTYNRLQKSLNNCEEEVFIGKVKYMDHIKENNFNRNFVEPLFTKRVSFNHENEVRLVYVNPTYDVCNENVLGKNIKMDLIDLIEHVYIYPDAAPWFVEVVNAVLEKFNIKVQAIPSNLYDLK